MAEIEKAIGGCLVFTRSDEGGDFPNCDIALSSEFMSDFGYFDQAEIIDTWVKLLSLEYEKAMSAFLGENKPDKIDGYDGATDDV